MAEKICSEKTGATFQMLNSGEERLREKERGVERQTDTYIYIARERDRKTVSSKEEEKT